ncbi:MAG: acyl-CoA dehydrogenase, partial [Gemmatimonadota bacterium]|nr:acyl-CoA dehydrogenase [Gemmatimonadota bacterium]
MMETKIQPFGAGFLLYDTDPEEVVTPEDLGDEERMLMQAFSDFAEREVAQHLEALEQGDTDIGLELF